MSGFLCFFSDRIQNKYRTDPGGGYGSDIVIQICSLYIILSSPGRDLVEEGHADILGDIDPGDIDKVAVNIPVDDYGNVILKLIEMNTSFG